jgi:cytoskeleton protein RodZ
MNNASDPMQPVASPAPAVAAPLLPGAALAAARVVQGLSIEDIARQLKLSVAQIKSIEADDHSRLPSPVFVRGFIRTYARVVKLDIAQLLPPTVVAAATAVTGMGNTRLLQDAPRVSMEPSPYRRVPAILAGIACVLLALAYYEFVLNPPPVPVVPASTVPVLPSVPVAPPAVVTPPAPTAAEPALPVVAQEPAKADVTETPSNLKKSAEPLSSADKGLHFVFKEKSWVEVRDGEGRIVYSRTNAAGSVKLVLGEPPFSVVVGGASGVELTYNGSRIDLAAYANDDVARLRLE